MTDVAIGPNDDVYVLTRSDAWVLAYDSEGHFRYSWGHDTLSSSPHGISIDSESRVYIADRGDHTVKVYTATGEPLAVWGRPGTPSDTRIDFMIRDPAQREEREREFRPGPPFNKPAQAIRHQSGDVFVADGYGNSRIHRFSPDGDRCWPRGVRPASGPASSIYHTA